MFIRSVQRGAGLGALALAGLLSAPTAQADVLYSTGFDAPTYSDSALVGQDGWLQTGTVTTNPLAVSNTATNGRVSLTTTGQDVNRPFTPVVTSGSVYLSADITVTAAQATGDYFLHLSDGGTSAFFDRVFAKSTTGGFLMALGVSSTAPTYGTTVLNLNQTYHIVARYDFQTGTANDTYALFIDPVDPLGVGDTPYSSGTSTGGTDASTISAVCLRQGSATNAATVTVDNIAVTAVPGPTSLALLGLAGLVGRRRR